MADLVTHIAAAHILKRLSPWPQNALMFAMGTCLPDLLGRAPAMAIDLIYRFFDSNPSPYLAFGLDALHSPIPFTLACLFIGLWWPLEHRIMVFRNLLVGGWLHMLIDLPQHHIDGGYRLLFPISWWSWELQWIGTEASLRVAPLLAAFAGLVELRYRWRQSRDREDYHLPEDHRSMDDRN